VLLYQKTLREEAARDLRQLALIGQGMAGGDGYKKLHAALKKQSGD
jgi:hypothetical protein